VWRGNGGSWPTTRRGRHRRAALDTIDTDTAGYFAEFTEVGLGDTTARKAWRALMSTQNYPYAFQRRAAAEAKGKAKAVLRILDRRGVHLPEPLRDQIVSCLDTTVLDAWIDLAVTIALIEDVAD
jgi:hypothetical protein